jgi:hypothetical protein
MDSDRIPTRLAVDWSQGRAEVELASGLVVASPLTGRAAEHEGELGRTDYDPESGELTSAPLRLRARRSSTSTRTTG